MTKFIILFSAVMAFACGYDCEKRKIDALERIATALEKMDRNCDTRTVEIPVYVPQEPTIKKTYTPKVNGRSLKAVPSTDFIDEDSCEDHCRKTNYGDYTQKMCIKQNCEGEY